MGKSRNEKKAIKKTKTDFKNIIPTELTNTPTIQLIGDKELTLDGCRGIVEYTDYSIKIKASCGVISVFGQRLNIKYLSVNSVVIEGRISSLEFIGER